MPPPPSPSASVQIPAASEISASEPIFAMSLQPPTLSTSPSASSDGDAPLNAGGNSFIRLFCTVFLPLAFIYVLSYLSRSTPAVLADDITLELRISAADLGFYASIFYLCMAVSQIPLGVALDIVGSRKTSVFLAVVAGIGMVLTWTATNYTMLVIGRAIMAVGMAAGMMSPLKAVKDWFPKDKVLMLSGFTAAAGSIGAMLASVPLEFLNNQMGWRSVFLVLGGVCFVMALVVFFVVPRRNAAMRRHRFDRQEAHLQIKVFKVIFTNRLVWFLVPPVMMTVGTTMSIQTLWAGPWFRYVENMTQSTTASMLLLIAIMQITGQLLLGAIRRLLRPWGVTSLGLSAAFLCIIIVAVAGMLLSPINALITLLIWVLFGFGMSFGSVSFAVINEEMPHWMLGRALTTVNGFLFLGVFLIQWIMGMITNLWPQDLVTGAYPEEAYRAALVFVMVLLGLSAAWVFGHYLIYGRGLRACLTKDIPTIPV